MSMRISGWYDFADDTPLEVLDAVFDALTDAADHCPCDGGKARCYLLGGGQTMQHVDDDAPGPSHDGRANPQVGDG